MADPRNYIKFKCQVAAQQSQSRLKDFGNAAGKIGDINILNKVAGGKISEGLRNIANISNSIRQGCGSFPTSIGNILETGGNWVLNQVGISPNIVDTIKKINPGAVNIAIGNAQKIFQQAKQGKFKVSDIPGYLQDLQDLERLVRKVYTPINGGGTAGVECFSSPYATDLIARAPKHKFMFVVQFVFNSGYSAMAGNEMSFVVKKSTRPEIKWPHDDVNFYNFRSKVPTKTEYSEMSMTFIDDMQNASTKFYSTYLRAMSPVANMGTNDMLLNPEEVGQDFSDLGGFRPPQFYVLPMNSYSASLGPLADDNKQILKSIRLFHIYDGGRLMNVYQFLNPRITTLSMDELDMSSSEGTEVSFNFNYDTVVVIPEVNANSSFYTDNEMALPGLQSGILYPLQFIGSPDAMNKIAQNSPPYGSESATQSCNPMNPQNTGSSTNNNPLIIGGGIGGGIQQAVNNVNTLAGDMFGAGNLA